LRLHEKAGRLDTQLLADWLFSKTLGHPYFLAFISRELWSDYHARPFANAAHLWPAVFSRLEQGKFRNDLAQLSEKEVGLLRAIARNDHEESNPAPFAQKFPHIYFKRLADKGLLIRAGRGRYKLYHPLFRQFLQQHE
jgi:hypothetical protein